jgi:hypothetical protein
LEGCKPAKNPFSYRSSGGSGGAAVVERRFRGSFAFPTSTTV